MKTIASLFVKLFLVVKRFLFGAKKNNNISFFYPNHEATSLEIDLSRFINEYRIQNDFMPLKLNKFLCDVAFCKSNEFSKVFLDFNLHKTAISNKLGYGEIHFFLSTSIAENSIDFFNGLMPQISDFLNKDATHFGLACTKYKENYFFCLILCNK